MSTTTTMLAVVYRRYGSPDVLKLEEVAKPIPGDDEVLVRVRAASLNALDWHLVRGEPYVARIGALRKPEPSTPGVNVAGVVEAVGRNVTQLRPGDEVFGNKRRGCAEYVSGSPDLFLPKPANLTLEQAAAIPTAGVTALQALRDHGGLKPGQKVLINGAAGGVGTFAVQIAKALGGEVTGVCSTQNVELVRSLGADHVIDYTTTDFAKAGERYDLVVDVAANRSLRTMRRVLAHGGTLVLIGASKGKWIAPLARFFGAKLLSRFVSQNLTWFMAEPRREDLLALTELIEAGNVTPFIDRTYPLSETADAMRYIETMHARGKVVITV
jgi:NADPH:quinone reductase-like Zn-dependent oxidoreductase